MHRTVINLKGTGESETDEIKQALDGQSCRVSYVAQSESPGDVRVKPLVVVSCHADIPSSQHYRFQASMHVYIYICSIISMLRARDDLGPSRRPRKSTPTGWAGDDHERAHTYRITDPPSAQHSKLYAFISVAYISSSIVCPARTLRSIPPSLPYFERPFSAQGFLARTTFHSMPAVWPT